MEYWGILIGLIGVFISIFISWRITRSYYKKTTKDQARRIKDSEAQVIAQGKILESLMNAKIRWKNDKRGTIVKRPDGTYAIDWKI